MLRGAVVFAVFGFLCYTISEYRVWLDWDKVLYSRAPGDCKALLTGGGSEDMAELDEDTILVSSGLNFQGKPGKMYGLYTNGTLEEARIVDSVNKDFVLEGPHGISIWKDPKTGIAFLYVLTHGETEESVEVFEISKYPLTLKHVKTITDSAIYGIMNDLVVVDKDEFYITQSFQSRNMKFFALSLGLRLTSGGLLYYDGTTARMVLSGMGVANGIAMSLDKRTLYVSEFASKRIHALNINNDGSVDTDWVVDIGAGPDNVQVDSVTGDLWVGSFPLMYRVADLLNLFGPHHPVAQILRVRLADKEVTDIEVVYANNGTEVKASSTAIYKNNKLFIGTVSCQLVMCDVHYLKK